MASMGEMWVFDSSCITQLQSQGGWLAASQICFNMTALCSYELCCQSSFDSIAA